MRFSYSFKQTSSIVISRKKLQGSNNTRLEYSTNFFPKLHQIRKLDCVCSQIHYLSEAQIKEPSGVNYSYEDYSDDSYQDVRRDRATSEGF